MAAVAVASFWIARALGPAQFGMLNFASAFMAIMLAVADMGMDVPVVLRLTSTPNPGALMGTVLTIRVGASVLAFLLAVALAFGLKHDDRTALTTTLIVSLCILAYSANALDLWFKAHTSARAPALARTVATLLAVCAKVVCLVLGLGVIALSWTSVLEAILAAIGLWWAFRGSIAGSAHAALSFDAALLHRLVRESGPYFFSSVAVLLYMKVDVVLLGYLSTNTQTGVYSLAQKLSEVIYVVPVVLIASAYPTLARRFLDGGAGGLHAEQMLFDLAVGGAIAAVLASVALARPLIQGIFGPAYESAIHIFYLHSLSCIAIAMNEARHRWLAAVSLQRYAPSVTAIGLLINVAMNLALIPRLGARGAAIATVVSYFASGYLASFLFKPLRPFGYTQTRALWPWGRLYRAARLWRSGGQLA
jgi:PST family polysaccharide transporter